MKSVINYDFLGNWYSLANTNDPNLYNYQLLHSNTPTYALPSVGY